MINNFLARLSEGENKKAIIGKDKKKTHMKSLNI